MRSRQPKRSCIGESVERGAPVEQRRGCTRRSASAGASPRQPRGPSRLAETGAAAPTASARISVRRAVEQRLPPLDSGSVSCVPVVATDASGYSRGSMKRLARRVPVRSQRNTLKPGTPSRRSERADEIGDGAEILGDDLGAAVLIDAARAARRARAACVSSAGAKNGFCLWIESDGCRCDTDRRDDRDGSRRRAPRCGGRAAASSRSRSAPSRPSATAAGPSPAPSR